MPIFQSNDKTAFASIQDLAARSMSVYGLDADTFFFQPRMPLHAKYQSATQTTLTFTELSEPVANVPSEGYVCIGKELIKYDGVSNNTLDNIVRAQEGTTQGTYSSQDIVYFVNHVVSLHPDTIADQIDNISAIDDRDNVYNTINVQYGEDTYSVVDADSIDKHGAEELDISAGLHGTERDLAKWLAETYLFRFKDLQSVVNLQTKL